LYVHTKAPDIRLHYGFMVQPGWVQLGENIQYQNHLALTSTAEKRRLFIIRKTDLQFTWSELIRRTKKLSSEESSHER